LAIVKNTFVYAIGNIIPKATGFILLPIYTLYLTPSDYGIIGSLGALAPILVVLFSFAFEASIFRLSHDYDTEEKKEIFFGTMFISTTTISFTFLLLLFIFHNYVDKIYISISFNPFFIYVIITIFIANFFELPNRYLMIKDKTLQYVSLQLFQYIISTGLTLWFVVHSNEGPAGFLKARMIATIILLPFF